MVLLIENVDNRGSTRGNCEANTMDSKSIWMVCAGRGAEYVDDIVENGLVAIGFESAGDVSATTDKETIEANMAAAQPNAKKASLSMAAAQVLR